MGEVKLSEAYFLKVLFEELNRQSLSYAVMRNYAMLPNSLGGSDLDIIISDRDAKQVEKVIEHSVHLAGGGQLGVVHSASLFKVFALGVCKQDEVSTWWGVRIDVSVGFRYKGAAQLVCEETIWRDCVEEFKGIRVLKKDTADLLGVIKDAIYTGDISQKYLDGFSKVESKDLMRCLLTPIGDEATDVLLSLEYDGENNGEIDCKRLRRLINRQSLKRNVWKHMRCLSFYYFSKFQRILLPPGKTLAMMGVDGAGKSTIIDAIYPALEQATHGGMKIEHLRPHLLAPLSRAKGKSASESVVTDPHKQKPSGYFFSMIRLIYYMVDYFAGYWIKIRMYLSREPRIMIYDRYAYDLIVDPRRFRIKLPRWILASCVRLLPRPDLTVCLYADAEQIFERKPELPLEELQRQIEELKSLCGKNLECELVQTSGGVEESAQEVLHLILDKFTDRNKRR